MTKQHKYYLRLIVQWLAAILAPIGAWVVYSDLPADHWGQVPLIAALGAIIINLWYDTIKLTVLKR